MAKLTLIKDVFDISEIKTEEIAGGVTIRSILDQKQLANMDMSTLVEEYDPETGSTSFVPVVDNVDEDLVLNINVNGLQRDLDYEIQETDLVLIEALPANGSWKPGEETILAWSIGALLSITGGIMLGMGAGAPGTYIFLAGLAFLGGGLLNWIADGLGGEDDDSNDNDEAEKLPTLNGSKNQSINGQAIPLCIGTNRVSPFVVGSPYNEFEYSSLETVNKTWFGTKNPQTLLLGVGYAPVYVDDIKLDELTLAKNVNHVLSGKLSYRKNGESFLVDETGSPVTFHGQNLLGEINESWNNNSVSVEISQFGEHRSLYDRVVKQKQIKTPLLYCYSKEYTDVAQEYTITWQGGSFPAGMRTNSIHFSENIPYKVSVGIDFPNGLYETHSRKGTNYYNKIPMNLVVQWRPYYKYVKDNEIDSTNGTSSSYLNKDVTIYTLRKQNVINTGSETSTVWVYKTVKSDQEKTKYVGLGWQLVSTEIANLIENPDGDYTVDRYSKWRSFKPSQVHIERKTYKCGKNRIEYTDENGNPYTRGGFYGCRVYTTDDDYTFEPTERILKGDEIRSRAGQVFDSVFNADTCVTQVGGGASNIGKAWIYTITVEGFGTFTKTLYNESGDMSGVNSFRERFIDAYSNWFVVNQDNNYAETHPNIYFGDSAETSAQEVKLNKGIYNEDMTDDEKSSLLCNPKWSGAEYFDFGKMSGGLNLYGKNIPESIGDNNAGAEGVKDEMHFELTAELSQEDILDLVNRNPMSRHAGMALTGDTIEDFPNSNISGETDNLIEGIEVRVVRLTPCYVDHTETGSENTTFKYQDVVQWSYLKTYCIDKQKLLDDIDTVREGRSLPKINCNTDSFAMKGDDTVKVKNIDGTIRTVNVQETMESEGSFRWNEWKIEDYIAKPVSDLDAQKMTLIAIKAYPDKLGYIQNSLDKVNVTAHAITPALKHGYVKWWYVDDGYYYKFAYEENVEDSFYHPVKDSSWVLDNDMTAEKFEALHASHVEDKSKYWYEVKPGNKEWNYKFFPQKIEKTSVPQLVTDANGDIVYTDDTTPQFANVIFGNDWVDYIKKEMSTYRDSLGRWIATDSFLSTFTEQNSIAQALGFMTGQSLGKDAYGYSTIESDRLIRVWRKNAVISNRYYYDNTEARPGIKNLVIQPFFDGAVHETLKFWVVQTDASVATYTETLPADVQSAIESGTSRLLAGGTVLDPYDQIGESGEYIEIHHVYVVKTQGHLGPVFTNYDDVIPPEVQAEIDAGRATIMAEFDRKDVIYKKLTNNYKLGSDAFFNDESVYRIGDTNCYISVRKIESNFNMVALKEAYDYTDRIDVGGSFGPLSYKCNKYIYQQQKVMNILQTILNTGRAYWIYDDLGRYEFRNDKPLKNPVLVINDENCISSTNQRTFAKAIAGYHITYNDEDNNGNQAEIYVLRSGQTRENHTRDIVELNLDGVTNGKQAWALGVYLLGQSITRRETWTRNLNHVGNVLTVGSLVEVQGATLEIGTDTAGRILQLIEDDDYIYGFTIDRMYKYRGEYRDNGQNVQGCSILQSSDSGSFRKVTVRFADSTQQKFGINVTMGGNEYTFKNTVGDTNTVLLEKKISKVTGTQATVDADIDDVNAATVFCPKCGDNISFGNVGSITSKAIVYSVTPDAKGKVSVVLYPYYDSVYTGGSKLPVYNFNMTRKSFEDVIPTNDLSTQNLINDSAKEIREEAVNQSKAEAVQTISEGLPEKVEKIIDDMEITADNFDLLSNMTQIEFHPRRDGTMNYGSRQVKFWLEKNGERVDVSESYFVSSASASGVTVSDIDYDTEENSITFTVTCSAESETNPAGSISVSVVYDKNTYKSTIGVVTSHKDGKYLGGRMEFPEEGEENQWFTFIGDDGIEGHVPSRVYMCVRGEDDLLHWVEDTNEADNTSVLSDVLNTLDYAKSDNIIANQLVDRLVGNEAFIKKLAAQKIFFEQYVASIQDPDPQEGDQLISMGRDPNNENDKNFNFLLQSLLDKESNTWQNNFYTSFKENFFQVGINGNLNVNGRIAYNGVSEWTPTNNTLKVLGYTGNNYVSFDGGTFAWSSDGEIWTTSGMPYSLSSEYQSELLPYKNVYIVLTDGELNVTEDEGKSWNVHQTGSRSGSKDLCCSENRIVGITNLRNFEGGLYGSGILANSIDNPYYLGVNFDYENEFYDSVCYGKSKFVVTGISGKSYISNDDGDTFIPNENPIFTGDKTIVRYGNGIFVLCVIHDSMTSFYYSYDGEDWNHTADIDIVIMKIQYVNGAWIANGIIDDIPYLLTSNNGTVWDLLRSKRVELPEGFSFDDLICIKETGKYFLRLKKESDQTFTTFIGRDSDLINDFLQLQLSSEHLRNSVIKNSEDIATNTSNIEKNTSDIKTNTENIATNTSNISTLQTAWGKRLVKLYGTASTANKDYTLSDYITNYKAIIVTGEMYTSSSEQRVSIVIPSDEYRYKGSSGYTSAFMLNGSISGTTRRIFFGFSSQNSANILSVGAIEGTSGHMPRITGVYGLL